MALFIVALVATMAYTMMARLDRDTQRTMLILRDTQAEFYAQGSIAWAMDLLRNNIVNKKIGKVIDTTPLSLPEKDMNGYKISSTIYDMQSRFNMNLLSDPLKGGQNFKRLLQLVAPDLTEEQAQNIVRAAVDWISPGNQQNQFSKYYAELPIPYRAPHQMMTNVSEVRLLQGMTPKLYMLLEPHITALASDKYVNAQTATAPVLASLSPAMTLQAANELIKIRQEKPFLSGEDLKNSDIVINHALFKDQEVKAVSDYFLVVTKVSIESQHIVLYTLIERIGATDAKPEVNIISQSKGVW